jgi:hypothetical protein
MKKHILFITILFINILSYAQYDCLKESLNNYGSAPSYLVVNVESPSFKGEAVIQSPLFYYYYKKSKGKKSIQWNRYLKLAYRDIKQGKYFSISDDYFIPENEDETQEGQYFYKIIIDDTVLNNSKKGIELFIRTYFDNNGAIIPPTSQNEPYDFKTIVKVIFDAGIQAGIGSQWSYYYIQDSRFYKEGKFVIPPEYRDSKE